jgi:Reverse transcriptase (RNA-dependent DNA polymerase)
MKGFVDFPYFRIRLLYANVFVNNDVSPPFLAPPHQSQGPLPPVFLISLDMTLDFSKAFDTVRHETLFEKLSALDNPDNVYNWIVDYFYGHTHCTTYQNAQSDVQKITASVIQGSAIGPALYVICASDLKVITTGNVMVKKADDTYLIPACNITTRETELDNVEK